MRAIDGAVSGSLEATGGSVVVVAAPVAVITPDLYAPLVDMSGAAIAPVAGAAGSGGDAELMFDIGSVVECKTVHEELLRGEVMAFEYATKVLVLKNPSSSGQLNLNDVQCVNLEYVSDIKMIKEASESVGTATGTGATLGNNGKTANADLPSLNPGKTVHSPNRTKLFTFHREKLEERMHQAIKERNYLVQMYKSGAHTDGIALYFALIKTLGESVSMDCDPSSGHCIVVGKNIKITAPYRADCVAAIANKPMAGDSLNYTKKLVEKFWRDQTKDPSTVVELQTNATPTANSNNSTSAVVNNNSNKDNEKEASSEGSKVTTTTTSSSQKPSSNNTSNTTVPSRA